MTASLVGTSGFAAIPTTALDLPLVQRLQRSPRFWVRVPITSGETIAASLGNGTDEKGNMLRPSILRFGYTGHRDAETPVDRPRRPVRSLPGGIVRETSAAAAHGGPQFCAQFCGSETDKERQCPAPAALLPLTPVTT
jgi:hypothetical protein